MWAGVVRILSAIWSRKRLVVWIFLAVAATGLGLTVKNTLEQNGALEAMNQNLMATNRSNQQAISKLQAEIERREQIIARKEQRVAEVRQNVEGLKHALKRAGQTARKIYKDCRTVNLPPSALESLRGVRAESGQDGGSNGEAS